MKCNIKFLTVVAVMVAALTSCGGGASRLFGDLPDIYIERDAAIKELREDGADESRMQYEYKKFRKKLESAAKEISGKPVRCVKSDDFKITSPLSLSYIGESSSGYNFSCDVGAQAAEDIVIEVPDANTEYTNCSVYLLGYDSEGEVLFCWSIGSIDCEHKDGKITIKAGTPVKIGVDFFGANIFFKESKVWAYHDAKELKIAVRE